MNRINNPPIDAWYKFTQRPSIDQVDLTETVDTILQNVKQGGDKALYEYTQTFDKVELSTLYVSKEEINEASENLNGALKKAIQLAMKNIYTFHQSQKDDVQIIETSPGIKCWRKSVPIEKVGLYIPGGSAPLFSTVMMLGIPAKIANCNEIIICTPPDDQGRIHPAILYTAKLIGIDTIFKIGGAQAIGAMCFGTETIPKVDKIFGPGNQYVTKAKELALQYGLSIDMPAGPSELLIIADDSANTDFVAADLLSQAEHGPDSQVLLLSTHQSIIDLTIEAIERQIRDLPRQEIAKKALSHSYAITYVDIATCIQFSNQYAPEHLIIASDLANLYVDDIRNAGSVFLGNYSCESAGDYASGTNHTLPTHGYAKQYSGVSLDSFVKKITFQDINKDGLHTIGKAIEIMAEAEGLIAHKKAVSIRLNT